MEATYQDQAPQYTYFVDWPNISILCSKYERLIIPEFFPFNLQTEQRGVESPVLLQSDEHTLGEEHQIILQVHVVLFSHQFPSPFKDPIYTVADKFLNGQKLAWIHLLFTRDPQKWASFCPDQKLVKIFDQYGSTFRGTHVNT